ncbi:MAG: glycoside hydrolase family 92 protein [Sphingomonadales bacterium]|nr:glycoside hydrolase family 92 protein [Sphingomonadales bacterium]
MRFYFWIFCFVSAYGQSGLTEWVRPLIGTQDAGHTFPGATVPFGAIQLSPDTDTIPFSVNGSYQPNVYRYCAGYQYADSTIVGFSHTHFSGTGHSDLGDILLMPNIGAIQWNPGTAAQPQKGYRSVYHHNEVVQPGYYAVYLDEPKVQAELTTTQRVGIHKYRFDSQEPAHFILDLTHGIYNYEGKNVWCYLRVENDTLLTGYKQTNGWGRTRTVYFAIALSVPLSSYQIKDFKPSTYKGFWRKFDTENNFPEGAGAGLKAALFFENQKEVEFRVALSGVSIDGALLNLQTEAPVVGFEQYKHAAQLQWQRAFSVVKDIEFLRLNDAYNFSTAWYHTLIGSTIYMDVDGRYRGLDQRIHIAEGFTNYTTFSLWDTYRAEQPFLNLFYPKENADMIESMQQHFMQSTQHMLPIWSHYANENWCMIGYHAVSVMADAVVKENPYLKDPSRFLRAANSTANQRFYEGLGAYIDLGYVPEDQSGSSVSKTLEYAYDDWCIAQMASHLKADSLALEYQKRAKNYRNVFDASSGFMRPKLTNGTFKNAFDPLDTHGQGFIEGNAWNYSFYVPHDPKGLIELMGGEAKFIAHLDSLFEMQLPDAYFAQTEDIMREGIIGNYVHGNEPSHHIPFFYNFTAQPWKTQSSTRMILDKQYKLESAGMGGNDDCGQMSAWYLFAALGFYPFAPGSSQYCLTAPLVKSAILEFDNGQVLRIQTVNNSDKNIYIQQVTLNGRLLNQPFITHRELLEGGELLFKMGPKPAKKAFVSVKQF